METISNQAIGGSKLKQIVELMKGTLKPFNDDTDETSPVKNSEIEECYSENGKCYLARTQERMVLIIPNEVPFIKNRDYIILKAEEPHFLEGWKLTGNAQIFDENMTKRFEGDIKENKAFGEGIKFNSDGKKVYEGDFVNNVYEGQGTRYYSNGHLMYIGGFKEGKFEGSGLKYSKKENEKISYQGGFKKGIQMGHGVEFSQNKIDPIYTQFKIGKLDKRYLNLGKGSKILFENYPNGKKRYIIDQISNFRQSFITLRCTEFYHNGNPAYEGEVICNERGIKYHGLGRLFDFSEEEIFEGEFENGRIISKNKDEKICWEGFLYNKKWIKIYEGVLSNSEGEEQDLSTNVKFKGSFNKFQPDGRGIEYDSNEKKIFEGTFIKGIRYQGIEFNHNEKKKFEGIFKNEMRYQGIEFNHNGKRKFEGTFKKGMKYEGIEFDQDENKIFEGTFKGKNRRWNGQGVELGRNGKKIFEGSYEYGWKHGEGAEFDHEGKKIYVGTFKDGKRYNGQGSEFDLDGNEIFKGSYKEGIRWNGEGIEFDLDGNEIFKGSYKEGIRSGKEHFVDGQLRFEGTFKDGKRHGEGIEFDKDGNKIFEGIFKLGKKDGKGIEYSYEKKMFERSFNFGLIPQIEFFKGKQIRFEGIYKDGKRWQGKGIEYYENEYNYEKKMFERSFNFGLIPQIRFFKGNQIIFEGIYKNGKRWQGKGVEYDENKGEGVEGIYQDGKLYEEGVEFDDDGNKIFEGFFKDGERLKGSEYDKKGNQIFEGSFKFGKRRWNGEMVKFDKKGRKMFEGIYEYGWRHGKGIDYRKGNKIFEGIYKCNKKHGKGIEFDLSGNKIFEGFYKCGEKHGKRIDYRKGNKIFEGTYKNGKKNGKGIEFDLSGNTIFRGIYLKGRKCEGIEFASDGTKIYEGFYRIGIKQLNGKKITERFNGKGIETDLDGNIIFKGRYHGGKWWDGEGILFDESGNKIYEGGFKASKRHGKGVQYFLVKQPDSELRENQDRFEKGLLKLKKCPVVYIEGKLLKGKTIIKYPGTNSQFFVNFKKGECYLRGELIKKNIFEKGKFVGINSYDWEGQEFILRCKNGKPFEGKLVTRDEEGKRFTIKEYHQGKFDGYYLLYEKTIDGRFKTFEERYYENGKLKGKDFYASNRNRGIQFKVSYFFLDQIVSCYIEEGLYQPKSKVVIFSVSEFGEKGEGKFFDILQRYVLENNDIRELLENEELFFRNVWGKGDVLGAYSEYFNGERRYCLNEDGLTNLGFEESGQYNLR